MGSVWGCPYTRRVTTPSALSPSESARVDGRADDAAGDTRPEAVAGGETGEIGSPGAATASAAATSTAISAEEMPEAPGDAQQPTRSENELRRRLGLDPLEWVLPRAVRIRGWAATAVVGLIAAVTRLVGIGHPTSLMFDEIYYVKDAYALWTVGYEAEWAEGSDVPFAAGDFSGMSTDPAYVVHPQFGKWLIGLGMQLFGPDSPVGWRIIPAIAGIATVVLLARLTMRLTRSPLLAGLAGLLLAIDGVGITESRIGLLDIFIGFFATLTMYCLVRDREWSRARLAHELRDTSPGHLAPRAGLRPWLWATGVALGLTCSIKWSGLYLLAVVGILVVVWDTTALHRAQAKAWFLEGVVARGFGDFIRLVPTAVVVYVALWWSWFAHDGAYKHGWAAEQRAAGTLPRAWLPDGLNDLLEYHRSMYDFHVRLSSEHPYESTPAGWLLQWRPTSFYWPTEQEMEGASCGGGRCVQAITSIGNIPVWWAAILALVVVLIMGIAGRDWRAWVPLAGYLGLYVPWFQYPDRTIFTFYTVAFVPFVVLTLTLALGQGMGVLRPVPGSREAFEEEAGLAAGWLGQGRVAPRGKVARFLGFGEQSEAGGAHGDPGAHGDIRALAADGAPGPDAPTGEAADGVEHSPGPADPLGAESSPEPATADDAGAGLAPAPGAGGTALLEVPADPADQSDPADQASREDQAERVRAGMELSGGRVWGLSPQWTGVPTWRLRREGLVLTGLVVGLALAFAALWWPIWTGKTVSYEFWRLHMLLDSWI